MIGQLKLAATSTRDVGAIAKLHSVMRDLELAAASSGTLQHKAARIKSLVPNLPLEITHLMGESLDHDAKLARSRKELIVRTLCHDVCDLCTSAASRISDRPNEIIMLKSVSSELFDALSSTQPLIGAGGMPKFRQCWSILKEFHENFDMFQVSEIVQRVERKICVMLCETEAAKALEIEAQNGQFKSKFLLIVQAVSSLCRESSFEASALCEPLDRICTECAKGTEFSSTSVEAVVELVGSIWECRTDPGAADASTLMGHLKELNQMVKCMKAVEVDTAWAASCAAVVAEDSVRFHYPTALSKSDSIDTDAPELLPHSLTAVV